MRWGWVRAVGVMAALSLASCLSTPGSIANGYVVTADSNPSWMPDGNRIASDFFSTSRVIGVLNPSTGEVKVVEQLAPDMPLSLSPDGKMLVYGVWILNLDSGTKVQIQAGFSNTFGPDGTKLAFLDRDINASDSSGNSYFVYIENLTTMNTTRTFLNASAFAPTIYPPHLSWSPDGQFIAFGLGAGIWILNVSDFTSKNVTPSDLRVGSYGIGNILWSPDGSRILFSYDEPLPSRAVRIGFITPTGQRIGTELIAELFGEYLRGQQVTWSPDGQRIAFADGGTRIVIADRNGGVLSTLRASALAALPRWSPDGTKILYVAFVPTRGGLGPLQMIEVK